MLQMPHQDFSEKATPNDFEKMSIEDKQFNKLMEEEVKFSDGHYKLPLSLKNPDVNVPNNDPNSQTCQKYQTQASKVRKDVNRLLYIHE